MTRHTSKEILEGKDVCYGCGKVGESGTMRDIDAIDFAIYCDDCWKILKKQGKTKNKRQKNIKSS